MDLKTKAMHIPIEKGISQFKTSGITVLLATSLGILFPYSSLFHCVNTFVSGDPNRQSDGQFRGRLPRKYYFRECLAKREGPGEAV